MTDSMKKVLAAVSAAMNSETVPVLGDEDIPEAKQQAVFSLICSNRQAFPYISKNVKLMWEQQELETVLSGIPYLIIKGSCAAIYYPNPIRRTMGDIDLIVKPAYFKEAYNAMLNAGYCTSDSIDGDDRHVHFKRNSVIIELHRKFATLTTKRQEEILDTWLYSAEPVIGNLGKYSFPMPPDHLNGLVLLTHINQHLEEGLGLRHIIDWVMFIKHSLSDQSWPSFKEKTDLLGLTTLAKVT